MGLTLIALTCFIKTVPFFRCVHRLIISLPVCVCPSVFVRGHSEHTKGGGGGGGGGVGGSEADMILCPVFKVFAFCPPMEWWWEERWGE